ncbi:sensor histidine kinase [Sporanaerobium hydrogeniformans]|uniref:sensor histidine kinase n=1 Tax=Sporanaerobium hydrogeniformans TaxID=3072179 RepID=UPI00117A2D13|nr:sensor histidine kinase [Sporanaerobium hydrogeniformans]
MKTILSTVANSHPDIDSIYLYLDGLNTFFSSKNGINTLATYPDRSWLDEYEQKGSLKKQWIKKRSYKEFNYIPEKEVISIFQPMHNISGLIVININSSQFIDTLNSSTSDNAEFLYLLDAEHHILTSNDNGAPLLARSSGSLQNLINSVENLSSLNNSWVTIHQKLYLFQSFTLKQYDISFLSLVPIERFFEHGKDTFLTFLCVLIGNCLVTLILSYITTKKNFQQIEHIVNVFESAEKGIVTPLPSHATNDEYGLILNNVINIFLKSNQLHQQLAQKQYKQEIAELAALQLQINPHFLFNTLQALDFNALRLTGKPTQLNQMIRYLSDILKYALEDAATGTCLQDELDYLKKYTAIQKMRYGEQFIIYYEVDDTILSYKVFRLMLQPLIENSISHGIRPLEHTGYIKLKAYARENHLYFTVIDSGVGLTKEEVKNLYARIQSEKSKNIGITNLNRRLMLTYGFEYQLKILSKKGMGTCISFRIPLENI